MADVTVTFQDPQRQAIQYQGVPEGATKLDVFNRLRQKYPDVGAADIKEISGVPSASLGAKIKAALTGATPRIVTHDIPQLTQGFAEGPFGLMKALGAADTVPARTPDDASLRSQGHDLALVAALQGARGATGKTMFESPTGKSLSPRPWLPSQTQIAKAAAAGKSTATIPALNSAAKAIINSPAVAAAAKMAGFGGGALGVAEFLRWLSKHAMPNMP